MRSDYYTSPAWYARRAKVERRARGRCEFCGVRAMAHCHHRTYARFGQERLADCMGVCSACHKAIHGLLRRGTVLTCAADSLLARGDSGKGLSALWRTYLKTRRKEATHGAAR